MKRAALVVALVVVCPRDARAIIGGTADPAPSPVVAISGEESSGASGLVCTGTLVAPNVVLTARHCIEGGDPGCTNTFDGVAKYVRIGVTTDANVYEVSKTFVPTGTSPCGDDVALLVLASAVPATDSRAAEVRLTKAVENEAYSAVGYGRICPEAGTQCSSAGQRLRKDGLSVDCLGCRPRTWRGTSDSTCVGDSGGPAFDSKKEVFGVTSVGGLGCTTAYYTRLDIHADFLRDTVKRATAAAGLAPPAWTAAAEGDAGVTTPPDVDAGTPACDAGTPGDPPVAGEEGCTVVRAPTATPSPSFGSAAGLLAVLLLVVRRQRPRSAT